MSGSLALGSSQDGLCTVTVSVTARIRKLIHVGYSYESIQFRYTAPLPRPTPCISAPQLYRHPRSPVTNYPAQAFRSENAITSRTTITRPGSRPPPPPPAPLTRLFSYRVSRHALSDGATRGPSQFTCEKAYKFNARWVRARSDHRSDDHSVEHLKFLWSTKPSERRLSSFLETR